MNDKTILCAENSSGHDSLADVSGVAYGGGPINQYWARYPLVIDLAGMSFAQQLPLLYNHYNEPEYRLGEIAASIADNTLFVKGGVDTETERGKFIVESGKKFRWQLSIGAGIQDVELVGEEESRTVNGRSFNGPFYHVKKTFLREVSVCAVGADHETSLQIAASFNLTNDHVLSQSTKEGESNMNKEKLDSLVVNAAAPAVAPVEAPTHDAEPASVQATADRIAAEAEKVFEAKRLAEIERKNGITAACGTDFADIAREAIETNWTITETSKVVAALKARAAKAPVAGPNIVVPQSPEVNAQVLEAALCFNQGIDENTICASYSEQVIDAGHKMRSITLRELLRTCAAIEGKDSSPSFDNNTIAAAFSSVSLPGILSNVANKKLLQAFGAQPIVATKLCSAGDLADFKLSERFRLTDVGDLEPVAADGELKNGSISEDKAVNQLDSYGKIFTLTRKMIYNDDLGAFLAIPKGMGHRAARKIDQLFHQRLTSNPTMLDGNALFSSAHANYQVGTDSALSADALETAIAAFRRAKDSDGQLINVTPKYLVVPAALEALALRLVASPTLITGANATIPALNVVSQYGLQVVASPYLDDASQTGWYLFGDPNQIDTFEIGYLQGRRVPTIEQGETNFNTLGMSFRVVFDLGVREQAYQGIVFNKGVA